MLKIFQEIHWSAFSVIPKSILLLYFPTNACSFLDDIFENDKLLNIAHGKPKMVVAVAGSTEYFVCLYRCQPKIYTDLILLKVVYHSFFFFQILFVLRCGGHEHLSFFFFFL